MSRFINWIQRANVLFVSAQMLNALTLNVPVLQTNKYVLGAQAILGILLPSVDGLGHKLVHGEAQDPSKR